MLLKYIKEKRTRQTEKTIVSVKERHRGRQRDRQRQTEKVTDRQTDNKI